MEYNLVPFESKGAPKVEHFRVSYKYDLKSKMLRLDFMITGDLSKTSKIRIPQIIQKENLSKRTRKNELWKSTCFEFFIKPLSGNGYFEVNVSPELEWNIYAFEKERSGMNEVKTAPSVLSTLLSSQEGKFVQSIFCDCTLLCLEGPFAFHATAVLEDQQKISYWARGHEGTKPDFHSAWNFNHTVLGNE